MSPDRRSCRAGRRRGRGTLTAATADRSTCPTCPRCPASTRPASRSTTTVAVPVKQNWDLLLSCGKGDDGRARSGQGPDHPRRSASGNTGGARRPAHLPPEDHPSAGPRPAADAGHVRRPGPADPGGVDRAGAVARLRDERPTSPSEHQPAPALDADALDWIATSLPEQPVANDCASFLAAHPAATGADRRTEPRLVAPVTTAPGAGAGLRSTNAPQAREVSLIGGWLPVTIQATCGTRVGRRRPRRRSRRWGPAMAAGRSGGGRGIDRMRCWWFVTSQGLGLGLPVGDVGVDRIDGPGGGGADPRAGAGRRGGAARSACSRSRCASCRRRRRSMRRWDICRPSPPRCSGPPGSCRHSGSTAPGLPRFAATESGRRAAPLCGSPRPRRCLRLLPP